MPKQDTYAEIDATIRHWARKHHLVLFHEFAGHEARFCYVSSSKGECIQVSVRTPDDGMVGIDIWTIEALDDRDLHEQHVTPISELNSALDAAVTRAQAWLGR